MKDEDGWTALMYAARNDNWRCVAALQSEVGLQNKYNGTALHRACYAGNYRAAKFLLEEAEKRNKDKDTPLEVALNNQDKENIDVAGR